MRPQRVVVLALVALLCGCATIKDQVRKVKDPQPGDCMLIPKGKLHPDNPDEWWAKIELACVFDWR